jgi:hypothetical protein
MRFFSNTLAVFNDDLNCLLNDRGQWVNCMNPQGLDKSEYEIDYEQWIKKNTGDYYSRTVHKEYIKEEKEKFYKELLE